jgi:hypothetical protein
MPESNSLRWLVEEAQKLNFLSSVHTPDYEDELINAHFLHEMDRLTQGFAHTAARGRQRMELSNQHATGQVDHEHVHAAPAKGDGEDSSKAEDINKLDKS